MDEVVVSESSEKFVPRKPGVLLGDSWNLCISNVALIVTIIGLVYIPLSIINYFLQSRFALQIASHNTEFLQENWPILTVSIIAFIILSLWCGNALYRALAYLSKG